MNPLVFIYGFISFLVVYMVTPLLIRYLVRIGLVVKDQNKKDKHLVPISGGLAVLVGVFSGLFTFIFIRTFFGVNEVGLIINDRNLMLLFAAMTSLLIITIVGFLDDLIINKSKDSSAGLRQWQKPLLTLTAAVPLMVVSAGTTFMYFPIIGKINFGIFFALVLVPIGLVGASNMVNMLEGYNGLGTAMGIIYIGMLGLYTVVNQRYVAALICMTVFFSLLAFYYYNKYPAKIFPGDSLTYLLGATIAIVAIIGNVERAALVSSIPFLIEFVLKARSKFKAQSYGYYYNGKIKVDYKKIYSLPHLFARSGKYTEKQIVYFMMGIQLICSLAIWLV